MRLGGVHQKRMAEVDGSRGSGGQDFLAMSGLDKPVSCQLDQRHPRFARRGEHPHDVEMGSHSKPRGRVIFSDIGKEEQHQQRPSLRADVDAPVQEVL